LEFLYQNANYIIPKVTPNSYVLKKAFLQFLDLDLQGYCWRYLTAGATSVRSIKTSSLALVLWTVFTLKRLH
ncbi:MAG: hypothetical protein ACI9RM_002908, partial [Ulvibacter sp.]